MILLSRKINITKLRKQWHERQIKKIYTKKKKKYQRYKKLIKIHICV